jgi:glycosyltransferase involved in cell wall biosynthesis/MFS family permease
MQEQTVQSAGTLPKSALRNFLFEAGIANILFAVTGGVFFTGFLLLLGANNFQIGLITSIPLLANIFAPIFSYIIDRSKTRKALCVKSVLPLRLSWFLVSLIPLLVLYKYLPYPLLVFSILFFFMCLLSTFASTSWLSWMADLVPSDERGYYFGKRAFVGGFVTLVISILAGKYLDLWKVNQYFGFSSLFGIGALFGLISYFYLIKLPEVPNTTFVDEKFSIASIPRRIISVTKNKNFLNLVLFNSAWAFAIAFISVYINVYLIKELKLSYTLINIFTTANIVVNLALTGFWGKIIDKYGCKPTMLVCANFIGLLPFLWMISIVNYWIVIPVMYLIGGAFWSGFNLAQFNIVLKLSPRSERATYIAFNTFLVSIFSAISPILGGLLLDKIGDFKIHVLFMYFGGFQILFLIGGLFRIFSMRFLKKVEEPKEEEVEKVITVVKSTIGVGLMEGVGTLVSYILLPITSSKHFIENLIENIEHLIEGVEHTQAHTKMNILQVVSSPAGGGRELDAVPLSKKLIQRGHNAIILCKKDSPVDIKAKQNNIPTLYTKMNWYFNPIEIIKIAFILRKYKIDVIHCHWTRDLLNLIIASKLVKRIPIVLTKHVYSTISKKDIFHKLVFNNVNCVIAICNLVKQNLIDTTPVKPQKIVTIYNGIDIENEWVPSKYFGKVKKEFNIKEDQILIGMVGRINEGKGQHILIEAIPKIISKIPSAMFLFAGKPEGESEIIYFENLKKRVKELNIEDKIIFTGFRNDIPAVMDSCDLIVLCSLFETFGMVLIEGMALAKPVVGTNSGGVLEIINDGFNGRLFPYGDSDKLAEAVLDILSDKEKAKKFGMNGRKIVEEKFDLNKMVDKIEKIYRIV